MRQAKISSGLNMTVAVILVDWHPGTAELQLGILGQKPRWSSALRGAAARVIRSSPPEQMP
jgi:hypothetical protein